MRKNHGFTLIELMVIAAIIGVLTAIAIPSLTESMARRRLEGVANELSADFQFTKSHAASINKAVKIVTTANGYVISNNDATPVVYKNITLDSKISLTSGITITFDPYRDFASAANNASNITIAHTQTTAQLEIRVSNTGVVNLCSPSGSFGGYKSC